MKTKYIIQNSTLALLFSVMTSCYNEETGIDTPMQEIPEKIISSYNLLDYSPNVYHDYFKQSENVIGFSSLKPNSLKPHSIVQRTNFSETSKQKQFSINSRELNLTSRSTTISSKESSDIYGKTIRFKVGSGSTYSRNGDGTEVEMYVPELVEITNPAVTNMEERYPLCDSSDFVLEWNADTNNEEGLVVIAEYFGTNAVSENSEDHHVLNTDYIEVDNGRASLSTALFQDIPNLSIVHIVLLRGNVAIEKIEGELYKFFAESHVRLPVILVKDVNTIVKQD